MILHNKDINHFQNLFNWNKPEYIQNIHAKSED